MTSIQSIQVLILGASPTDYSPLYQELKANQLVYQEHTELESLFAALENHHCDCLILDLHDDFHSGQKSLTQIRQHASLENTPILVVSNFFAAQNIRQTYALGANYILLKPLNFNHLFKQLNSWLGQDLLPLRRHNIEHKKLIETRLNPGQHILVADDDAGIQTVVSKILEDIGCVVSRVEDGQSCLNLLNQLEPDLLLLNLNMPGINGHEVLKQIQADQLSLPVIVMSGEHSPAIQDEVRALGAQAYLEKPFHVSSLVQLLESHLITTTDENVK